MEHLIHCGICGHLYCKHDNIKDYIISWSCSRCGSANAYTDNTELKPVERENIICATCKKHLGKIKLSKGNLSIKCQYCGAIIKFP